MTPSCYGDFDCNALCLNYTYYSGNRYFDALEITISLSTILSNVTNKRFSFFADGLISRRSVKYVNRSKRFMSSDRWYSWPNGIVPYDFDPELRKLPIMNTQNPTELIMKKSLSRKESQSVQTNNLQLH